jgi:hypothetical protein
MDSATAISSEERETLADNATSETTECARVEQSRVDGTAPETELVQRPPAHILNRPRATDGHKTWFDRVEAFVSRLAVRDTFWHRVCSLIWLPLAAFSGIRMKQLDAKTFTAVLPFSRFNRNWYRAMAGAALLANSEIAAGAYVFGLCGADYTVVCKNLNYTFLRPCYGPAVYRISPRQDIKSLLETGAEFNIGIDMDITQQSLTPGERERRVGKCEAVFHVTPKTRHKERAMRKTRTPVESPIEKS